jgi:hypothetical protein
MQDPWGPVPTMRGLSIKAPAYMFLPCGRGICDVST